jgi:hypothetical protein
MTAPSSRYGAAVVYDPAENLVLLFGGGTIPVAGGLNATSDTWVLQNGAWVNLTATLPISPPARADASIAYDPVDHYVVMFGGIVSGVGNPANNPPLNDTWVFQNMQWTRLVTLVAPSARRGAAMVWDEADGYVVLFGGELQYATRYANDTWTFRAGVWTQMTTTGPVPPARSDAAISDDVPDAYVLLFGGWNGVNRFGDTWTYAGGTWTELTPPASPSPRVMGNGGMVYDPALGESILFGGEFRSTFFSDTWGFSGGAWINLTSTLPPSPPGRYGGELAFLPSDDLVLLFGGEPYWPQTLNDSWLFGDVAASAEFVEVGLRVLASPCSSVQFGDVVVFSNATVAAARISYGARAVSCQTFVKWTVTGGIEIAPGQSMSPSALVTVAGPGTISAEFSISTGLGGPPPSGANSSADVLLLVLGLVVGFGSGVSAAFVVLRRRSPPPSRPAPPKP